MLCIAAQTYKILIYIFYLRYSDHNQMYALEILQNYIFIILIILIFQN